MRIPSFRCLFNRHRVDRAQVSWDGWSFVGPCRHCGKPMRRKDHNHWLLDWRESPASDTAG